MPLATPQQQIQELLTNTPTAMRGIVEALQIEVSTQHPDANIKVWSKQRIISFGFGPAKMTQHHTYIGIQPHHVNLGFYYGTSLSDPDGHLEGSGRNLRHLKVKEVIAASSPHIKKFISAAIQELRSRLKASAS